MTATYNELVRSLLAERFTVLPELRRVEPGWRGWTEAEQAEHLRVLNEALGETAAVPSVGDVPEDDDDVDHVAVHRFCCGENPPLNRAEQAAAASNLLRAGHTRRWVAERLGVSTTTLARWLKAG